jgi:hypothetical protein
MVLLEFTQVRRYDSPAAILQDPGIRVARALAEGLDSALLVWQFPPFRHDAGDYRGFAVYVNLADLYYDLELGSIWNRFAEAPQLVRFLLDLSIAEGNAEIIGFNRAQRFLVAVVVAIDPLPLCCEYGVFCILCRESGGHEQGRNEHERCAHFSDSTPGEGPWFRIESLHVPIRSGAVVGRTYPS